MKISYQATNQIEDPAEKELTLS